MSRYYRTAITTIVAGLALSLPLITQDGYFLQVASAMGIAVILALGLSILYGYAGQLSFAQAGLFGVGAYGSVILTTKYGVDFLTSLGVGILLPGLVAFLIGIPTLRLRGHYLAIATLALQLAIVQFFIQASGLTGGTVGVFGIERPTIFGVSFKSAAAYYELIAVCTVLAFLFAERIVRSRFGRALTAVREDETAAMVLGMNPGRIKLAAFTISAMFAGLAGTLFAYQILFISPVSFSIDWSITVLSMVVIGGVGSNLGAVIGAVLVTLVRQFLFSFGDLEFLVYGVWLMAVIVFFPGGIVGVGRSIGARLASRRTADGVPGAERGSRRATQETGTENAIG